MNRTLLLLSAITLAGVAPTANAALFCARTAAELRAALTTAQSNGEADEIRIARGTYYGTTAAPFQFSTTEPHGLRITGGWTLFVNQCVISGLDATRTVLDGSGQVPVLRIKNFVPLEIVPISVRGLTVRNGRAISSDYSASGLTISGMGESAQQIEVDRLIAHSNVSTQDLLPAVSLTSDLEHIRFTNSIVRGNVTANAAALHIHANHGGSHLDHLTIVDNVRGGPYDGPLDYVGTGHRLSHSVLFNNLGGSNVDIAVFGGVEFNHNAYGTASGPFFTGYGNFAITNPLFDSSTTLRPTAASQLNNNGGWRISATDVYGRDRLLGGWSDIGAAERIE